MRVVNSRVIINNNLIRRLERASTTALEKTLVAMRTNVAQAQVTPFDTGATQGWDTYEDFSKSRQGEVKLVTTNPYVRRIYFHPEINFHFTHNTHARAYWYEPWISGDKKEFCKNAFTRFYRQEAGL